MGCRTTDFLLSRSLRAKDASPFIGHVSLREGLQKSALVKTRNYLHGEPHQIRNLFLEFPYVAAWCVSHTLNECYGECDNAIYSHLERTLGVSLTNQGIRKTLYKGFCRVCDKLGLPTIESRRMVDLYLLHAGVSVAQLPVLINAFKIQEIAFGPPQNHASMMMNRWEDEALEFLPPAVRTLRRAIQWDETAWHASLYFRILEDPNSFEPKLEIERHFLEEFQKPALQGPLGTKSFFRPPRPRLIWGAHGLALNLSRVAGRIRLWLDHDSSPFRVRGGEDWILPQPWPAHINWSAGDHEDEIAFLPNQDGLAIFDRITGQLVWEKELCSGTYEINARDVVILSRRKFRLNGEEAHESGETGFIAFARLQTSDTEIECKQCVLWLRARPRRRLSVTGGEIARGPMGTLHAATATIEVETGFERNENRWLRIRNLHQSANFELNVVGGVAAVSVGDLLAKLSEEISSDPVELHIYLLPPADDPKTVTDSRIFLRLWVWPAFSNSNGMIYVGKPGPCNFLNEQSQHVSMDGRGRLVLDHHGGYVSARAAFEIDDRVVHFDLPWPDVVVLRCRPDGTASVLRRGERLVIGEESRFDTVTVRCPDPSASMIVCDRIEDRPFAHGLPRHLAVRDLLKAAVNNNVILRRGNGNELILFELVRSMAPTEIRFLTAHTEISLCLSMTRPVDAIAFDLQHETGDSEFAEVGFGRRPVGSQQPPWLHAELRDGNPTDVDITVSTSGFHDGLVLARIYVRPDVLSEHLSKWCPLRNSQGETYAIIFGRFDDAESSTSIGRRFESINNWLTEKFVAESWKFIETTVVSRWKMLGTELATRPGGFGTLMIAGAVSPPDHSCDHGFLSSIRFNLIRPCILQILVPSLACQGPLTRRPQSCRDCPCLTKRASEI